MCLRACVNVYVLCAVVPSTRRKKWNHNVDNVSAALSTILTARYPGMETYIEQCEGSRSKDACAQSHQSADHNGSAGSSLDTGKAGGGCLAGARSSHCDGFVSLFFVRFRIATNCNAFIWAIRLRS